MSFLKTLKSGPKPIDGMTAVIAYLESRGLHVDSISTSMIVQDYGTVTLDLKIFSPDGAAAVHELSQAAMKAHPVYGGKG